VTPFVLALLAGGVGGLLALGLFLIALDIAIKPYARRRVAAERRAFAAHDAKTWRAVPPMLVGARPGSLAHLAGVMQADAPVGLSYTFRARDTNALPLGVVRVSFEAGNADES
jgi:hypothetical protein